MGEALANSLAAGLSLWQHKDARKYLDRVINLRRRWREAYNSYNLGLMDAIELELCDINKTFCSSVGVTYTSGG